MSCNITNRVFNEAAFFGLAAGLVVDGVTAWYGEKGVGVACAAVVASDAVIRYSNESLSGRSGAQWLSAETTAVVSAEAIAVVSVGVGLAKKFGQVFVDNAPCSLLSRTLEVYITSIVMLGFLMVPLKRANEQHSRK